MFLAFYIQFIFVTIFGFLTAFQQKASNIFRIALGIFLIAFAGFRGVNMDRDYAVYVRFFESFTSGNISYFSWDRISIYEPSFYLIPQITNATFGSNYLFITFIIFAILGVFVKLKSFKISNSIFLSAVIYSSYYFFIHEMTQIRAGVATGILMLSLVYVYDRKPQKFLLFVLFACMFHYSSILFLGIYFLNPKKVSSRMVIISIAFAYLVAFFRIDLIDILGLYKYSPKLALYSAAVRMKERDNSINIFHHWLLLDILITMILTLRWRVVTEHNKYLPLLLKVNLVGILAVLFFSSLAVVAGRTYELFGTVQYLLYPCLVFAFRLRFIGYLLCILIGFLHILYILYFNPLFEHGYYTWLF